MIPVLSQSRPRPRIAALFTPDSVPGLALQLELYRQSSGTTITDYKGGRNFTVADATLANNSWVSGGMLFNGLGGASASFAPSALGLTSDVTIFAITSFVQSPSPFNCFFNFEDPNAGNTLNAHLCWSDNNTYFDYGNNGGTGRVSSSLPKTYIDGTGTRTIVLRKTGTAWDIIVDATTRYTGSNSGAMSPTGTTRNFYLMQGSSGFNTYGKLSVFNVFNRTVSDANIVKLRDYYRPRLASLSTTVP